jgi:two-component SAPR family response regulator
VVRESGNLTRVSIDVISNRHNPNYWKRILIVDDEADITTTFKVGLENRNAYKDRRIAVQAYNDPRIAISEFQPNIYDLLLTDINMPFINGFDLSERILNMDINVKICLMSSGELNWDALREIYPTVSLGCFIRKPITIDSLVDRIMTELD